jgi:hypothetical protein
MDLTLCKATGMSYQDIQALPQAVYEVLVDVLNKRLEQPEAEPA